MKKIIFYLSFGVICLFLAFIFFPKSSAFAKNLCLEIHGKVTASNWAGGTVEVGCGGNTLSAGCTGQTQTITPGPNGDFLLTKCGCSDNPTGKCLFLAKDLLLVKDTYKTKSKYLIRVNVIENLPTNCSSNLALIPHCGSNGKHINVSPNISCSLSPTPTPSVCPVPPRALNVKVTCEKCWGN